MRDMTVRQKVAQLIFISYNVGDAWDLHSLQDKAVEKWGIGGVMPFGDPLASSMARLNDLQCKSNIPLTVCLDCEWGASMRYKEFKTHPRNATLANYPDSSVYNVGREIGRELKSLKMQVAFAPVVDVNINPKNKVIGTRSFGSDPDLVATKGVEIMRGIQDEGVIACAKHFPGHGDTSVDSHKGLPVLTCTRERLDSVELKPFRAMIKAGVKMVMIGHLSVPALDPSGAPASVSKPIVTGLLREELGFKGLIVTDALQMRGVLDYFKGNGPAASLAAYEAGADIILMPKSISGAIDAITQAIESGRLSEKDLDERVKRVMMIKARAGMLEPDYIPIVKTDN